MRRIECVTGEVARRYLEDQADAARQASDVLKTTPDDLPARIEALVGERKKLEKELADAKKALALGGGSGPADEPAKDIGGIKFAGRVVDGVAPKDLRGLVDSAKQKLGEGIVAYIGVNEGKAALVVGVTDGLKDRFSAVDLVKAGALAVGGEGGGGRPDMAQAGGPDGANAGAAITAIERAIAEIA